MQIAMRSPPSAWFPVGILLASLSCGEDASTSERNVPAAPQQDASTTENVLPATGSKDAGRQLPDAGQPIAATSSSSSGVLSPDRYKGKQFKDLSEGEQIELCAAVKADVAPLEAQFDKVHCLGPNVAKPSCEKNVAQCTMYHDLDKRHDPNCEDDHEVCKPLARVDEYLRCIEASKKAVAAAASRLTSCDPQAEFKLETPPECETYSINVECGAGGLIDSWAFYW